MAEIGLAGLPLDYPHSGTAVYARNLVQLLPEVAPDLAFRLFVRQAPAGALQVTTERLRSPFSRFNHGEGGGARLDKLAWETLMLPLAALRAGERLLHSLYFAAPAIKPVPTAVTIHDLIPMAVPGYHRSSASAIYSALMARTVRGAAAIITVSEHARGDILRHLKIPESRVFVTPEAADGRFGPIPEADDERVRARYRLPDRYFLYLGGAERRKNLEMLVRAWASVQSTMIDREVRLVLVADFPPSDRLYPDVPGLVGRLGAADSITLLARVQEDDKPALYRSALGFCFPSMYEGFGLPPLEAMASGTPVLSSNATSLPEVVGDAGVLLDPHDRDAWAQAMLELVESSSLRADLKARGLARAAAFSWRQTAEQTAAVYREVLAR